MSIYHKRNNSNTSAVSNSSRNGPCQNLMKKLFSNQMRSPPRGPFASKFQSVETGAPATLSRNNSPCQIGHGQMQHTENKLKSPSFVYGHSMNHVAPSAGNFHYRSISAHNNLRACHTDRHSVEELHSSRQMGSPELFRNKSARIGNYDQNQKSHAVANME